MSNVTGIILGIVGAVVGFVVTGYNPMGAVMGFSLGMMVGQIIDPMVPDVPQPGQPQLADLDITSCQEGDPLPDFFGTTKITGNIVQTWGNRTVTLTQTQEVGGKGGGGQSQTVVTGYEYHLSWVQAFSYGKDPVDKLLTVLFDDVCVYSGELTDDDSDGEETITLGEIGGYQSEDLGAMTFYFGTSNQVANAKAAAALDDPTLASGLRGLCYAVFDDINIGSINRCPTVRIVVSKYPSIAAIGSDTLALCNCLDYNPAFALWYIMEKHSEMDSARLDSTSFAAAAAAFQSEDYVGVSLLLSKQVPAMTYVEGILNHVGSIMIETDGQLVLKRLRDDISIANMPAITDDNVLSEPMLKVGSWLNTFNDIKIQYSYMDCTTYPFQGEFVEVIDSWTWRSSAYGYYMMQKMNHVCDDLYLVTTARPREMVTFRINADGTIQKTILDSWDYGTTYDSNYLYDVHKVTDTDPRMFAHFYQFYPSIGTARCGTLKVNDDGTFQTKTFLDNYNFGQVGSNYCDQGAVKVAAGYYAFLKQTYNGAGLGYKIDAVLISIGGSGAVTVHDNVNVSPTNSTFGGGYSFVPILEDYSSIYVAVWSGANVIKVQTLNISMSTITPLDRQNHTIIGTGTPDRHTIVSGMSAGFQGIVTAYEKPQSTYNPVIVTASISGTGNVTYVDELEISNVQNAYGLCIRHLSGKYFLGTCYVYAFMFEVDSSGNITYDTANRWNIGGGVAISPYLFEIGNGIWARLHQTSNAGVMETFKFI